MTPGSMTPAGSMTLSRIQLPAPPFGIFVTGTDTGVGKTLVACALALLLRRRGLRVAVSKPVVSGAVPVGALPPTLRRLVRSCDGFRAGLRQQDSAISPDTKAWEDPLWLKLYSGDGASLAEISPIRDASPAAPLVAHRGAPIRVARLAERVRRRLREGEVLLVEGIGGLAVPLTKRRTVADLAVEMGFPLLVVARAGLGTLNHTILTVDHARSKGLEVAGVILNGGTGSTRSRQAPPFHGRAGQVGRRASLAERTNPRILQRTLGVPVLGPLPWLGSDPLRRGRVEELLGRLSRGILTS